MSTILDQFEIYHINTFGYTEQDVMEFAEDLKDWMKNNDYEFVKKEKDVKTKHNHVSGLLPNFNI